MSRPYHLFHNTPPPLTVRLRAIIFHLANIFTLVSSPSLRAYLSYHQENGSSFYWPVPSRSRCVLFYEPIGHHNSSHILREFNGGVIPFIRWLSSGHPTLQSKRHPSH